MLARNSDLWRLAASSCRLLSAISRKRRAFWIARADWVAKVVRRSHDLRRELAGRLAADARTPMTCSSRSSGTARSAR